MHLLLELWDITEVVDLVLPENVLDLYRVEIELGKFWRFIQYRKILQYVLKNRLQTPSLQPILEDILQYFSILDEAPNFPSSISTL